MSVRPRLVVLGSVGGGALRFIGLLESESLSSAKPEDARFGRLK